MIVKANNENIIRRGQFLALSADSWFKQSHRTEQTRWGTHTDWLPARPEVSESTWNLVTGCNFITSGTVIYCLNSRSWTGLCAHKSPEEKQGYKKFHQIKKERKKKKK